MRRFILTTAMAVLVSTAAVAEAQPTAESPPPLDLAALAKQSKIAAVTEDRLRAALVKGTPEAVMFSTALDLGGGVTAVAWSECNKTACRGKVATLTGDAEHPKPAKQAALVAPTKVFFVDGFAFEPPALADLDGDGTPEIVLHYRASESPRAALGSVSHEYIAVYAPKDLSLIFSHELRRAGADSEDACQWTLAQSGDRLIASGQCNQRVCLETTSAAGCKPNRQLLETWRKAPDQKCYVRIASQPSAPAASPPAAGSQTRSSAPR